MKTQMKQYDCDECVDAVVIGTGAGGAPLMARLAQAGLSVVALEAGQWFAPQDDYAQDEVEQSKLYWLDERLSAGTDPVAFGANNSGCGVGGSTLHYGAFVPRPDPRDLRIQSDFGVGKDWPFSFDELLPYLVEVEQFIGVSGPSIYPWDRDRTYPLSPLALNGPAELMQRGCEVLNIQTSHAPLATLSQPYVQDGYDERPQCVKCGFCHQGCRNGSKASMDVTYIPAALRSGAEIRSGCFVHGLNRNAYGKISEVVYTHDGQNYRQFCRNVFLCAGGIESPRLLLHCDLANSSGQIGLNFMVHVAAQVWGTFAEDVRPYKGFPASLISEDTVRPEDADFAGGYLMQSLGIVPVTWAMQVARGRKLWGERLVRYLRDFNHVGGIGINGECLPSKLNFLELSSETDRSGMPKPLIHFSMGENEKKMHAHASDLMAKIWTAAGASDIWTLSRTAHTIGTCRMGTDPSASVVNSFGQSFDVPNLWISDNSTFPSSLCANPALTIAALSLRTADCFLSLQCQ